ncbi:MAG: ABC transporter ATP-binding protein [Planctomycetes bacterium]|nr:ABC transporter ATP-binding protein [Planctomycetota bacterium]
MSAPLLAVESLGVEYQRGGAWHAAIDGVSLSIEAGRAVGLVGESGCGKSTLAAALLRALPENGRFARGAVRWCGRDLATMSAAELLRWRGREIAWIEQEPSAALDPLFAVGDQIAEGLRVHAGLTRSAAHARAVELLAKVGLAEPELRARARPHQLSLGMRQRVGVAMAVALQPALLIADEPTSALDASLRHAVLDLIDDLRRESGMALLLISHDLRTVAERCDEAVVMYAGRFVERGPAAALLEAPRHPYARALAATRRAAGPLARGERFAALPGAPSALGAVAPGCAFHPRCPLAETECTREVPPLAPDGPGFALACPVVARRGGRR